LHRAVIKVIESYGGTQSNAFRPRISEVIQTLRDDPKIYPKKGGRLKDARAVRLRFRDGVAWRAVYTIHESMSVVFILSIGPHDTAYAEAKRRIAFDEFLT
jgi:mRNA-degrading endonuclease RelE of RelBE toxin-antitoxin system